MKRLRNFLFRSYLDDGERIIDMAHPHVIVLKISSAKTSFFGIIIPIILYVLFPIKEVFIVSGMWILVGLGGLFYHFLDWYYDTWLITNLGVIAITRNGFFDIKTQRVDFHLLQDVSYIYSGFLQSVLNYGDITLDKISGYDPVILKNASNPKKLERMLSRYRDQFLRDQSFRDHNKLKNMLADMIAYHSANGLIDESKSE